MDCSQIVRRECPGATIPRRALELAAAGAGTDGHFLGLKEGMFMLSAVLPLDALSAEEFGRRILMLAAASKRVADELLRASAESGAQAGAAVFDIRHPATDILGAVVGCRLTAVKTFAFVWSIALRVSSCAACSKLQALIYPKFPGGKWGISLAVRQS